METTARHTQTPISLQPLLASIGMDEVRSHYPQNPSEEPIVPGPFVVLQGTPGDGMQNTIDSIPQFPMSCLTGQEQSRRQRARRTNAEEENSDISFFSSVDYDHESENRRRGQCSSSDSTTSSFINQFDHSDDGDDSSYHHIAQSNSDDNSPNPPVPDEDGSSTSAMLSSLGSSSSSEQQQNQRLSTVASTPGGPSSPRQSSSSMPLQPTMVLCPPTPSQPVPITDDSFIVVQEDNTAQVTEQLPATTSTSQRIRIPHSRGMRRSREGREISASVRRWHTLCRGQEMQSMRDLLESMQSQRQPTNIFTTVTTPTGTTRSRRRRRSLGGCWWRRDGKLLVLSALPWCDSKVEGGPDQEADLDIVGDLPPGCTVLGTEIVTRVGRNLPFEQDVVPDLEYQFLRIESPLCGFVLYRCAGYNYLMHGLPTSFCQPKDWLWRVTCPDGAFVRRGLELTSQQIATLPYGSLVKVTRKTINAMGLSRLKIDMDASVAGTSLGVSDDRVEGWVSEALNPLSGQRGPILQPLPFPIPALYRVLLPEGAVIRSDVELSSSEIRVAPMGSILKVVGRVFSEHPMDQCVERLRLAGDGGWVSVRLNRPPPLDELVVDLVGIDGSFDPDDPGKFHLYSREEVVSSAATSGVVSRGRRGFTGEVSPWQSGDEGGNTIDQDMAKDTIAGNESNNNTMSDTMLSRQKNECCLICLSEERTATIVHGGTGHIACCLTCARIIKARGDRCPVCRLPIDSVIQHFWA